MINLGRHIFLSRFSLRPGKLLAHFGGKAMLKTYFKYPAVLCRMRRGHLAGEIDAIANHLESVGYAHKAANR